jgi:hypothetical protein
VEGNVIIDSEPLLMTDFMNLKIKSDQSFEMLIRIGCACIFIEVSTFILCMYESTTDRKKESHGVALCGL